MWMFIVGIIVGIWVYVDAKGLVNRTIIQGNDKSTMSPTGWGLFGAFFGIFGLPVYLYKRSKYKKSNGIIEDNQSKQHTVGFVAGLIIVAGIAFYYGNQDLFKSDVRADVERSIRERFDKDAKLKELDIKSFHLVHQSGNNYRGLLEVTDGKDYNERITVDVVHDGRTLMWEFKR